MVRKQFLPGLLAAIAVLSCHSNGLPYLPRSGEENRGPRHGKRRKLKGYQKNRKGRR